VSRDLKKKVKNKTKGVVPKVERGGACGENLGKLLSLLVGGSRSNDFNRAEEKGEG